MPYAQPAATRSYEPILKGVRLINAAFGPSPRGSIAFGTSGYSSGNSGGICRRVCDICGRCLCLAFFDAADNPEISRDVTFFSGTRGRTAERNAPDTGPPERTPG